MSDKSHTRHAAGALILVIITCAVGGGWVGEGVEGTGYVCMCVCVVNLNGFNGACASKEQGATGAMMRTSPSRAAAAAAAGWDAAEKGGGAALLML